MKYGRAEAKLIISHVLIEHEANLHTIQIQKIYRNFKKFITIQQVPRLWKFTIVLFFYLQPRYYGYLCLKYESIYSLSYALFQ